jgi:hypothetical protein
LHDGKVGGAPVLDRHFDRRIDRKRLDRLWQSVVDHPQDCIIGVAGTRRRTRDDLPPTGHQKVSGVAQARVIGREVGNVTKREADCKDAAHLCLARQAPRHRRSDARHVFGEPVWLGPDQLVIGLRDGKRVPWPSAGVVARGNIAAMRHVRAVGVHAPFGKGAAIDVWLRSP